MTGPICPACGGATQLLFSGSFCPNDCDRSSDFEVERFTLEQLRNEHSLVVSAAKKEGGCFVVDPKGQIIFSLWIPQESHD